MRNRTRPVIGSGGRADLDVLQTTTPARRLALFIYFCAA